MATHSTLLAGEFHGQRSLEDNSPYDHKESDTTEQLTHPPSTPTFWRVFNHKSVLDFVRSFLCIHWDDHTVFIFPFVYMAYHIDWFVCVEEFLHPWDKACLIIMCDLFRCCWILFARILLKIFASMFIRDIGLQFSFFFFFLWYLFLVLVVGWWWHCGMSLGVFLSVHFSGGVWAG